MSKINEDNSSETSSMYVSQVEYINLLQMSLNQTSGIDEKKKIMLLKCNFQPEIEIEAKGKIFQIVIMVLNPDNLKQIVMIEKDPGIIRFETKFLEIIMKKDIIKIVEETTRKATRI
ncbi:hypothetical protein BpHYR1_042323 [Brachionus plicatilis]|uniref:Uncharacterized protein n=1 Tax=Brachionus plicatilis TaxID=10195 RepID=A0A3M7PQW8_BRAPC|nr:hypothetical protein BpHYR1_042323 [Brachionus plicatilis]